MFIVINNNYIIHVMHLNNVDKKVNLAFDINSKILKITVTITIELKYY